MENTIVRHFVDMMSDKFLVQLKKQLLRERAERVHRQALLVHDLDGSRYQSLLSY